MSAFGQKRTSSLPPQFLDLETISGDRSCHAVKLIIESPIAIERFPYVNPRDDTSFVIPGYCLAVIVVCGRPARGRGLVVPPPHTSRLANGIASALHIRVRPGRQHFFNICANPGPCRYRVFVNSMRRFAGDELHTPRADKQRKESRSWTHCVSANTSTAGQKEPRRNQITNP